MAADIEMMLFPSQGAFAHWLAAHHEGSDGVWLQHSKKGAPVPSVSYQEALEVALCFGWIDGQKRSLDLHHYLQRWTPRRPRSLWSKVNREKVLRYIEEGKMQPSGLAEIERAKKMDDGMPHTNRLAWQAYRPNCMPHSPTTPGQPNFSPLSIHKTAMQCYSGCRQQ